MEVATDIFNQVCTFDHCTKLVYVSYDNME